MGYKPVITDQDKQNVLYALRQFTGTDNRIPVMELCEQLGIKERRKLRFIVHEINSDTTDHLVLTDTDEGGYWLAVKGADPEPAVKHYWEEESRGLETLRKAAAMKRKIISKYGPAALDPTAKLQAPLF